MWKVRNLWLKPCPVNLAGVEIVYKLLFWGVKNNGKVRVVLLYWGFCKNVFLIWKINFLVVKAVIVLTHILWTFWTSYLFPLLRSSKRRFVYVPETFIFFIKKKYCYRGHRKTYSVKISRDYLLPLLRSSKKRKSSKSNSI